MIIDDDVMTLKIVKSLVDKTDFLNLAGMYESPVEASNALSQVPVDLILLDVEMPDMTGLELIATLHPKPQVIMISGKNEYALDAFAYEVTDYLLKPITSYARFLKAVQRARNNIAQQQNHTEGSVKDHIYLKVDSLLVKFDLQSILWIEAYGDYIKVKTREKVYTVYATLKSVEDALPVNEFLRIHRSYIVRTDQIANIDVSNLQVDNKVLPIGNSYKKHLMERIKTL